MPEILLGIVVAVVLLFLVFSAMCPSGCGFVRRLGRAADDFTLIGMRLRRISPQRLVDTLIMSSKAGLNLTVNQLEKHFLAETRRVVKSLVSAQQAGIKLTLSKPVIDLAGRDVLQAVQMSVIPR